MNYDETIAHLDDLLAESPAAASRRVTDIGTALRERIRAHGLVLCGAGGLGQRTLGILLAHGCPPCALIDNDPRKQGTAIHGIPVLDLRTAAAAHPGAISGVCIWGAQTRHRYAESASRLTTAGLQPVPFTHVLAAVGEDGLPFYAASRPAGLLDQVAGIRRAADLFADDLSRTAFIGNLRWRLRWDFDALPRADTGVEYFPTELIAFGEERFLDGGAYDGDTLRCLAAQPAIRCSAAIACEPDPETFKQLAAWHASVAPDAAARIQPRQVALSDQQGTLRFAAVGSMSSAGSSEGAIVVPCTTINELADGLHPTLIKLDIEGAEPEALRGADRIIPRDRPVLAVCAYHRPDHLWRLALQIQELVADYRFFLRPYHDEAWDLVLYAVPRERVAASAVI